MPGLQSCPGTSNSNPLKVLLPFVDKQIDVQLEKPIVEGFSCQAIVFLSSEQVKTSLTESVMHCWFYKWPCHFLSCQIEGWRDSLVDSAFDKAARETRHSEFCGDLRSGQQNQELELYETHDFLLDCPSRNHNKILGGRLGLTSRGTSLFFCVK